MGPVTRSQIKSITQALNTPPSSGSSSLSYLESSLRSTADSPKLITTSQNTSSCSCSSCTCSDSDHSTSSSQRSQDMFRHRYPKFGSRMPQENVTERSSVICYAGSQSSNISYKNVPEIVQSGPVTFPNFSDLSKHLSSNQPNSVRTYSTSDYKESSDDSRSSIITISSQEISCCASVIDSKSNSKMNRPSVIKQVCCTNGHLSTLAQPIEVSSKDDWSSVISISINSNKNNRSFTRFPSPRTIRRNSVTNLVSMRGSPVSNVRSLLRRRYKLFACPEKTCNLVSTRVRTITEHHKYHHPKPLNLYHCKACRQSFSCQDLLDIHRVGEHNDQIKCTLCNCMYASRPCIEEHAKMHQKHYFKCDTCSVPFVGPSYLSSHISATKRKETPLNLQPHAKNLCAEKKIYILEKYERRDTKIDFNLPDDIRIECKEPVRDVDYLKSFCKSNKNYYDHIPWRIDLDPP